MVETILGILEAGLSIWASKEKTRYVDQLIRIKTEYRKELSKPSHLQNDAVIDDLRFQLKLLGLAFSAAVKGESTEDRSQ